MNLSDYFRLLGRRAGLRGLWLAAVVSLAGDWFNTIATLVIVQRYTDSVLAVGGLFLARTLPPVVMGPLAGVVADRFDRKWVMVVSNLLRAVVVLGFLLVDSPEEAWLVYALTVTQFVLSAFFEPATNAILPNLLEGDDEFLTANTLLGATWSAMLTLGAGAGGFFAAFFGVEAALIIDSVTFLVASLILLPVDGRVPPEEEDTTAGAPPVAPRSGVQDFVDGLRYLLARPAVAVAALCKGLMQVGSIDVMIPVYAASVVTLGEEGEITIGLMFSMHGLGSVVGPIITNRWSDGTLRFLRRGILIAFLLLPPAWLLIGLGPTLPVILVGSLLRGMVGSINWTYSTVLIQRQVNPRYLGRVFSFDFINFTLAVAVSVWVTSWVLDNLAVSPRTLALWFSAASVLPIAFWLWAMTAIQRELPR